MYKIQQLGVGGILDQSIAIIKDNFGTLLKILLLTIVPFAIAVVTAVTTLFLVKLPSFDFSNPDQQAAKDEAFSVFVPLLLIAGAIWLLLVLPVAYGAIIQAVAHLYLGRPITAKQAIKDAFRLWGALVGTAILYYLALIGGFILLIIPGFIFQYWFTFCTNVVVIEGTSGAGALSRSRSVVRGNFATTLALSAILWVISNSLPLGTHLIPSPLVASFVSALLQGIAALFATVCWVVFYFSCRCANENFDLQYLAETIGKTPALTPESELAAV